MRRGIAACHDMGNLVYMTLLETVLAEAEAEAGEIEAALARINHAVALTERTDQRWNEADTFRVRGEILLKRDSSNNAPAEETFVNAISIAKQRRRGALSCAQRYRWRNCIGPPAAPSTRTVCSRMPSQAFRPRRNFRRSNRR
jgi:hypothetical protein